MTATPQGANFTRVWQIYQTLHPKPDDIISPARFFVREGELIIWDEKKRKKKKRHFFLFNDLLLLCKKDGSKKFWLRVHVTLRSPNVSVELMGNASFNNEFRVHCRTRTFILYAVTPEQRKEWVDDIEKSIKGTHPDELKLNGNNNNTRRPSKSKKNKKDDDDDDIHEEEGDSGDDEEEERKPKKNPQLAKAASANPRARSQSSVTANEVKKKTTKKQTKTQEPIPNLYDLTVAFKGNDPFANPSASNPNLYGQPVAPNPFLIANNGPMNPTQQQAINPFISQSQTNINPFLQQPYPVQPTNNQQYPQVQPTNNQYHQVSNPFLQQPQNNQFIQQPQNTHAAPFPNQPFQSFGNNVTTSQPNHWNNQKTGYF